MSTKYISVTPSEWVVMGKYYITDITQSDTTQIIAYDAAYAILEKHVVDVFEPIGNYMLVQCFLTSVYTPTGLPVGFLFAPTPDLT